MRIRLLAPLCLMPLLASVLPGQTAATQIVRFHTNLGDIDVTMIPTSAPKTVANFLNYVNKGAYNNSVIHRSVPNFVIQGGGYQLLNHSLVAIPADPPVVNEYSVLNTRGTLAMAKLGTDPNSATNEWFFNLGTNASLNSQNGGFTVFGRINSATGLAVMDKIASEPVNALASPFDQLPLVNYLGGDIQDENYIQVLSVAILAPPAITPNGIVSASGFGGFPYAAPGSFIEIYGSGLAGTTRSWTADDFTNGNAPLTLDGVIVSIDGKQAFVNYISPTQVNVQVPSGVSTGGTVKVLVSYKNQSSASVDFNIKPLAPGLLAPPAFNVGGKQYVAAIHSAAGGFVGNANIPGISSTPAAPGETLTFYGVGFGPVGPSSVPVAGQIVTVETAISTALDFKIGDSSAKILFAGLAPTLVGLYQFNVTVPADAPDGDLPVTVLLGSGTVPQTLFISVKK